MQIKKSTRDLAFAGVAVVALLGLVVFRGRSSTTEPEGSRKPASETTKGEVRLCYFPNVTHAPALVGVANGEFAKELTGYQLTTKVVNAGPEAMEALLAGEIDFSYVGPSPAINTFLKSHGEALRVIAGACEGGASLICRGDETMTSVKDLAGKKVAVPQLGGTQDVSCRKFLVEAGMTTVDKGGTVAIIPVKNPDILALFKRKQIDAAWVPEPWASRIKKDAGAKTVIDERDLWPGHKFTTTVLVVRKKFADEHPDAVAEVLKAHIASVDFLQSKPEDAKKVVNDELKRLSGKSLNKEVLDEAWSRVSFTVTPDPANIMAFAQAAFAAGYAKTEPKGLEALVEAQPLADAQKGGAAK
ncbi:ABC transporter substrate-binding protein [soil metagenome]